MTTDQDKLLSEMVIMTEELAEQLLEQQGLSVEDVERFVRYVWLVQSYPLGRNGLDYYRENLAKWVENEQESYYGEHESKEAFCEFYLENYCQHSLPNWVVIDYAKTWYANLRHDFTTEDNGRGVWVWSDIY